ncbi:hypothetical protein BH11ACT3_BH11ACT3_16750 [soil metagenome]
MDKVLPTIVILAVIALAFFGMVWGWRARRRRQSTLGPLAAPPAELGAVVLTADLLYVATTRADAPLDRIAVAGLGYRSRAAIIVAAAGIELDLAGAAPAFIPADAIHGAGRATWTIDRAISKEGLVFVRWALPGVDGATEVDSYFRPTDPATLVAAIDTITPAPAPAQATSPKKDSE